MSALSSVNTSTLFQGLGSAQGASRGHHGFGSGGAKKAAFESAAVAAGADPAKLSAIEEQIEAAIKQAKKSGRSADDPARAVRDAVDSVLEENGVDVKKFRNALRDQTLQKLDNLVGTDVEVGTDRRAVGVPRPAPTANSRGQASAEFAVDTLA